MTVLDYPLTFAPEFPVSVCPSLDPINTPPAALVPLLALAAEQRARVLAIVPAVIEIAEAEDVMAAHAAGIANVLTVIVLAAAAVGLATAGHDPQGTLFGEVLGTVTDESTRLIELIRDVIHGGCHAADVLTQESPHDH